MMAEGGNKLDGVRKERKDLMPPFSVAGEDSVAALRRGWALRSEKRVKKVGIAIQQRTKTTDRVTGILDTAFAIRISESVTFDCGIEGSCHFSS